MARKRGGEEREKRPVPSTAVGLLRAAMAASKSTSILRALFVMLCVLAVLVESANPTRKAPEKTKTKKAAFRGYYSWDESRVAAPDARPSEDVVVAEYIDSCMREPGCQWHCGGGREDCDCVCKVVGKSVGSTSSRLE